MYHELLPLVAKFGPQFPASLPVLPHLVRKIGHLVQVNKKCLKDDSELEPGMVGILVAVKISCPEVFHLHIDTRPFNEHNFPLMDACYYDNSKEDRPANLTALEAGFWKDINTYYIDGQTFPEQFDFHQKVWHGPLHSFLNPMEAAEHVSTNMDKTFFSICANEYELKCPNRHPLSDEKLAQAHKALAMLKHTQAHSG